MCGRFALATPDHLLAELFRLRRWPSLTPRFNIAPTQPVAVVRPAAADPDDRDLVFCRWGLIPSWSKDPSEGGRMINARSEGVTDRPAFRHLLRSRRCLIPADAFYEWAKAGTGKIPHRIRRKDGSPFAFAGLWDAWGARDGSVLETCTILTTVANDVVAPIHDRMPVILDGKDHGRWLSREARVEDLLPLLRPCPAEGLMAHPVGTRVNDPRHDDPACGDPVRG